jgi:DNA-binding response OmpR family regulator
MSDQKRIIVIDDDPDFLDYVRIVLTANGYAVQTAHSTQEGLAQMRLSKPDLVIVDFMMSYVLDGVAVCLEMAGDAQLAGIPVLLVSAVVSERDDQLFTAEERKCVAGFMSKPVEPALLVARIEELTAA